MQRSFSSCLGVAAFFFVIFFTLDVAAQTVVDICDRTSQVRDEILGEIPHKDCATVTDVQLLLVEELDLADKGISELKSIDFSGLSSLETLFLSNNTLSVTPPEDLFADLSDLQRLELETMGLTTLPTNIFAGLSRLDSLLLSANNLTDLPANLFANLSRLMVLDLSENPLTTLPEGLFADLFGLESLDLSKNSRTSLPEGLFSGLTNMDRLYLSDNSSLTSLPANLFEGLSNLMTLFIDKNPRLTTLPADIFEGLGNSLVQIVINECGFEDLPESLLADLSSLKVLQMVNNSLTTLPPDIFDGLDGLQVYLAGNPLECLPQKILDLKSQGKIIIYSIDVPSCADLPPVVTLNLDPEEIMEGEFTMVTASLSAPLSADMMVEISATPNPSATLDDYRLSENTTLTIVAGETSSSEEEEVTITARDDNVDEPDETLTVIGAVTNTQGVTNPEDVTLTIQDDDNATKITLAVAPPEVNEGAENTPVTVTARLDFARTTDTEVTISVEDGTAMAGIDYMAVSSLNLTIPAEAMEETGTFTFTPIVDDLDEPDEEVQITGTTPVDDLDIIDAKLILLDSDPTPEVTLNLDPEGIMEGKFTTVKASLSFASGTHTTIEVSVVPDPPATTADYELSSNNNNTLTIEPGQTNSTGEVTITARDDNVDEPDETLTVIGTVTNTQGVTNPEDVTLTIQDDDNATKITLAVAPPEVNEDAENTPVTVTARLDFARSTDTEVTISVEDGTAMAGIDYMAVSSLNLTIPAEAMEGTEMFTFTPIPDNLHEPEETIWITGTTSVNGLRVSPATLTLYDTGPIPEVTLKLDPEVISEARGRTTVTAHLSTASSEETVVTISADAILPATDLNYQLSSNRKLTIAPGLTTSTELVTITAVDNLVDEPDKILKVGGQATNANDVTDPSEVTLTILDDDEATGVKLAVSPSKVNEDEGSKEIMVTARLDTPRSEDTEVLVSIRDGSAMAGDDYKAEPSFDLTISAGEVIGTKTFDLTLLDDLIYETAETITIIGESPAVGPGESGTYLTILDNDELITLTIQDQTFPEDVGMAQLQIEVTPAAPFDLNVPVQTIGLTATERMDYTPPQNSLQIPAGSRTAVLEIPILDDPITESAETFQVRLSEVAGTVLDPGEATVTIEDNDVYLLRVEDASELESSGSLTFTVILDPPHPSQTVRVAYETRDGTAIATTDYVFQRDILDFPPNIGRRELSVPLVDDFEAEMVETFLLELSTPEHAELADDQATGTIRDDDAPPVANLMSSLTVQEDAGRAPFEVTLTHSLSGRETEVDFIVTDQTAQASLDYRVQTQSPLRFSSGQTTQFIEVQILDDELFEGEETFQVQLTNIQNGELGQSEGQGIIVDNEAPVTVRIQDVEVSESEPEAVFPVVLSGRDSRPRTFTYMTEDGSAMAGQDYTAMSGTVTFPAGALEQEIRVPILDDQIPEESEIFLLRLSGDGIEDVAGQATILDDEVELMVSIYDERALEDAGELLLPIRLSRPSSQAVMVEFASSDETATAGSDYVSSKGIVIFEPGSTEGKIRIQVLEDSEVEPEETFQVTLANVRHAEIDQGTGIGTILDNDGSPGVSVQSVMVSLHTALFDVSLSMPSSLPVLVSYASEDGSAHAGEDYEPVAGQVTFAPGEVSKTIKVKLLSNDPVWEAKTFSIVLLSAVNAEVQQARTEAVMEEENEESIRDAYVSRVLRTWASQVVEALSRRMEGMAQCRIPDLSWLRHGNERRTLGEIFRGCGAQYMQGGWSVWGQGAFTRMHGREGALSLRSDVTTMMLGTDYTWSQGWMAGLLAAQSWDQGTYETPTRSGTASSRLTGIYPYVSYQTGAGMHTWLLLGLGRGETELETLDSEVDASLVALGLTGTLTGGNTGRLGYEVDAFWATAETENGSDLRVRRVRAGVEGNLRVGPGMQPYLEAALRQDGGDAETGLGIELGGGLRWSTNRLRAELGGRTLVLHTDEGLREWGLMGSVEYGNPGGLGPSMRVRPLWGNVYGGDLWRKAPLHSMALGSADQNVEIELGYGTPIKKSLGRSIVGMTLDSRGRAYRVGYNLRMEQGLQFSVATTARTMEANEAPTSYGVSASMGLKW